MYGKSVLFSCRVVSLSVRYKSTSRSTKKLLDVLADMPKANSARISEAQRQRQNISKKSEKYAPSTVYLQVLGSGARGAPNTLYVFTDQKRYLFNCGESTQRLAHEHKVKLSKLEHIFITSKSWTNIGGLPGLSLTLQDVGVPKLTLHGPEGLDELYQATKRFVIMKDMNVNMAKCTNAEDFEDSVMSVKYVILGAHENLLDGNPVTKKPKLSNEDRARKILESKELEKFLHDDTDYYRHESRQGDQKKSKNTPRPRVSPERDIGKARAEKVLNDLIKMKKCTVAYICTLKKRLGTLDLAKCVEFGVPPGPMLGQLKAGFDVVLDDGKLVLSKDVKTPDDPGPVFIVLEVPELSYLKETEFSAHFETPSNPTERVPSLVVHYTPPHVFKEPKYRAFMAMFGRNCKHLVLNSQNSCLGSEAVHRTQHKLHLLDPDIFPLLKDASIPAVWNTSPLLTESPTKIKGLEELKNKIALAQFQNIMNKEGSCKGDAEAAGDEKDMLDICEGRTLNIFHLRPKKGIDRSTEPKLHIQDYIQETMDIDGFVGSLDAFRKQVDSIRYLQGDAKEFPKVVFLGTGSCIPSKTRNTSGIVLQVNENKSMLLDCGEGTFGQLVRFYGPKRVNSFLRTVKAIYISHLHADHHIGLIGVLQARRQAFKDQASPECPARFEPVYLLAPGQIMSWLTVYDQQFERIRNEYTLVPNQKLLYTEEDHGDMTAAALASIGVQQIKTCLVSHCPNAFGVAIDVNQDNKITYSGDTIPCEELVKIGNKSTLLIHEATMEDELAEEARVKMHSTTSQAIEQGRLMKAQYTVLTHFSQRYARLPRLNAQMLMHNQSVGIAFDNMQITMSDLKLLPTMYAPLQLMFAEHCMEMELKAAHRARLRELHDSDPNLSDAHRTSRDGSASSRSQSPRSANYRESSRIRQEMKGKTVTGVVRGNRGLRGASKDRSSTRSNSRASSLSENSGGHRDGKSSYETQSAKSYDINYRRRTMSKSSRKSTKSNSSSKSNISSHSKKSNQQSLSPDTVTLASNVSRPASSKSLSAQQPIACHFDNKLNVMRYTPDAAFKSHSTPSTTMVVDSAYGKPLVTDVNKRLKIMRYTPTPISCTDRDITKIKQSSNTRSPVRSLKSYNKETPSIFKNSETKAKILIHSIYLITHLLIHFMALHTAYYAYLVAANVPPSILLITAGVLFWTATQTTVSGKQLRPSLTNPTIRPERKFVDTRPESARGHQRIEKKNSSIYTKTLANTSAKRAAIPSTSSRPSSPTARRTPMEFNIRDTKIPLAAKPRTPESKLPAAQQISKGAPRKPFEPLRDIVTERLKQPLCKGKIVPPQMARPHSVVYSSKSYKPQLEDIKSSFLLLNKQAREQTKKLAVIENDTKICPKPAHDALKFDEQRRKQLMEVKKKFQSKGFFADSKYDKIEGLNWISWK